MSKITIKANVGRRPHRDCMNLAADQMAVISMLNAIPEQLGGTAGKLKVPVRQGYCSDELFKAILTFQRKNTGMADGIIEPGGPAMVFLNALAERRLPLNLVGAGGQAILQGTATDIRIDAWRQVPQKYKGPTVEQEQTRKWDALKEHLKKDQSKSNNAKLALVFLKEQERLYGKTTGIGCWARGFGLAFVKSPTSTAWEQKIMLDEILVFNGDRQIVKLHNYGNNQDPPVLVFEDLTHYVMKKNEIVHVAFEYFTATPISAPPAP